MKEQIEVKNRLRRLSDFHRRRNQDNEFPKKLEGLSTIWHDPTDYKNIIEIYNKYKGLFMEEGPKKRAKKKLLSCFFHALLTKKWLNKDMCVNPTSVAKIFCNIFQYDFFPKDRNGFDYDSIGEFDGDYLRHFLKMPKNNI